MKEYHSIFLDRNHIIIRVVLFGLALSWATALLSEVALPDGSVTQVSLWLFAALGISIWVAISLWLVISIILLWVRDVQTGKSLDQNNRPMSYQVSMLGQLPPVERFEKADVPIDLLRTLMMEDKADGR